MRWAAVIVLALVGCSADADEASPSSVPSESAPGRQLDEMVQLDGLWEDYAAHRTRMAAGDLSDESSNPCDDTSDCPLGFDVDGWYYVLEEVALEATLIGAPIADLGDGSMAHVIVGAEPAVYLARVDGDRSELLVTDVPSVATTRERTLALRADRCSISVIGEPRSSEIRRAPRGCDDPSVRWLVGYETDRWVVDDSLGTSDGRVWRTEPIDPMSGQITGPSGSILGPFDDPIARLDVTFDRQCVGHPTGECRVGYGIDERTADRLAATVVRQNVAEGSDVAFETTYVRVVFDRLADGGWWSTELGPSAVHRNGVGSTGLADAERRFERCCDATTGALAAP